ncbi:MAG TPA: DUF3592 domain-containing protein [Chthoniobacterales bacterium]|nr:DUF3592 domain-containing protein [Chthoniobacterales bacterium]
MKIAGPIICLVIGVALLVFGVVEHRTSARLQREGVEADATIIDKKETQQRRGKRRTVSLRFRDQEGIEHATSAFGVAAGSETWKKPIGATVRILYLPNDRSTRHSRHREADAGTVSLRWRLFDALWSLSGGPAPQIAPDVS